MHEKIMKKFNGLSTRSRLLFWAVVLGAGVLCYLAFAWASRHESTDDAFIDGHVVTVSPRVAGHIARVYVTDNQMVKSGELLFEIDSRDYLVREELAQADLKAALAELKQAGQDVTRYRELLAKKDISEQQYEKAALRAQTAQAQLDSAKAHFDQAELNLSYTKIRAPEDGQIAKKAVEPGAFVQVGQAVLALVPQERWVTANFKETQLTRIHPGEKVAITIDAYPGKVFHGHVDSIQHGTGSRFSLLPAENATGNYIKVTQRVPVKIVFDESFTSEKPLALGMSVIPEVETK